MTTGAGSFEDHVRDVPDWPRPGVVFKDITPLLASPQAFSGAVDALAGHFEGTRVDKVLGIEARGFIFAAPVAYRFGAGFVPVRKGGKLPWQIERQEYALEYGTDLLEIHRDGVQPDEHVLIVDDVLASGGTAAATARLVERLGGHLVGFAFLIELAHLGGRRHLRDHEAISLVTYGDATVEVDPDVAGGDPGPAAASPVAGTPEGRA